MQDLMKDDLPPNLRTLSVPLSWPESLPLDEVEDEVFFGKMGAVGTAYGEGGISLLLLLLLSREDSEKEVPWTFFD